MAKQLGFEFAHTTTVATREAYPVPPPATKPPAHFEPYPKGKLLAAGDTVTLIHRLGAVKQVKFAAVAGARVHVFWPVANDALEISTKTGHVVNPRKLREWRLEPNALEMARVARGYAILDSKIAVE